MLARLLARSASRRRTRVARARILFLLSVLLIRYGFFIFLFKAARPSFKPLRVPDHLEYRLRLVGTRALSSSRGKLLFLRHLRRTWLASDIVETAYGGHGCLLREVSW